MSELEKTISFIAQNPTHEMRGENFLSSLLEFLGPLLDIDYVKVDYLELEKNRSAKNLSLYSATKNPVELEYTLENTPEETLLAKKMSICTADVLQEFPKANRLIQMGIVSYIGIPLWNKDGRALGIMSLMHSSAMANADTAVFILQMLADRVSSELEYALKNSDLLHPVSMDLNIPPNDVQFFFRTDQYGTIQFISPSVKHISGYPADELMGKKLDKVFFKNSSDSDSFYKELQKKEGLGNFEIELLGKNGSKFWGRIKAKFIADKYGESTAIEGSIQDITELIDNKFRFEQLGNATFEGICIHHNGIIEDFNDRFLELFKYSKEEMLGFNVINLATPTNQPSVLKHVKENLDTAYEAIGLRKDGSTFYGEVRGRQLLKNNKYMRITVVRDISIRKLGEIAIEEREKKYRELLEMAPDAFFHGDKNGSFIGVNNKSSILTGYTKEELLELNMSDIISASTLESKPLRYDLLISGETIISEREIVRKNKSLVEVEMNSRALPDGTMISFFRDISERRKAENELLKLSRAVEQSPASVIISDIKGRIEYVNKKFTETTAYLAEEAIGKTAEIFHSEYTSENDYNELRKCLLNKEIWKGELQNRKKNGELFWEKVQVSPIIGPNGKVSNYLAINEDITESKLRSEALKKSEFRVRQQRNAIANIAVKDIVSSENKIESFNKIVEEAALAMQTQRVSIWLFSENRTELTCVSLYDTDKIVANPTLRRKPAEYADYIKAIKQDTRISVSDALEDYRTHELKDSYLLPLGIQSLLDAGIIIDGDLLGLVCFENVGEKVEWHADQESFASTIAALIAQTIASNKRREVEKELILALEKAEESDRLKSAFLANMSHEIRTPMNGILGFASLLNSPELTSDEQKEYIRIIEKSGIRMLNIINDIVDISKIESGQMSLSLSETAVAQQINDVCDFFKPEVEAKGMKLINNSPDDLKNITIQSDKEKVYAVLTNLVKNAIKYSNKGNIEIGYSLKSEQKNPEIEFYVKDTGIGIPENKLDSIFQRFIQVDVDDVFALQGAGLGLAISKAYIEMLEGKIWVNSTLGEGSTFLFTLPFKQKKDNENKIEELDAETQAQHQMLNKKLILLIAEDDETSEMILKLSVKKYCRHIFTVRNGQEAVNTCKEHPEIDLILMDIKMPVMDGHASVRKIRKFNKNVIIIAQTAYGLSGDMERALASGCNDYIKKPVDLKKLDLLIRKYFV